VIAAEVKTASKTRPTSARLRHERIRIPRIPRPERLHTAN
jgi:hypothetical protein